MIWNETLTYIFQQRYGPELFLEIGESPKMHQGNP